MKTWVLVAHRTGARLFVAEPRFLGLLNRAMDGKTAALVSGKIQKDLAHIGDQDVLGYLGDSLSGASVSL